MATQRIKPRRDTRPAPSETGGPEPHGPVVLKVSPVLELTDEQLLEICSLNDALRIERNAQGELELMPPTGGITGNKNANIIIDLGNWARRDGRGVIFDSSTGFTLPNGAMRSPDAAWVLESRWKELAEQQQRSFPPICPDFVIELRSESDRLRDLQRKMEEYLANGARLGWLIDPLQGRAYVYRPDVPVEELERPDSLSGDPELSGFVLDLKTIWEPTF